MRSCMMALELLSTALGAYLAGFIIYFVRVLTQLFTGSGEGWIPRCVPVQRVTQPAIGTAGGSQVDGRAGVNVWQHMSVIGAGASGLTWVPMEIAIEGLHCRPLGEPIGGAVPIPRSICLCPSGDHAHPRTCTQGFEQRPSRLVLLEPVGAHARQHRRLRQGFSPLHQAFPGAPRGALAQWHGSRRRPPPPPSRPRQQLVPVHPARARPHQDDGPRWPISLGSLCGGDGIAAEVTCVHDDAGGVREHERGDTWRRCERAASQVRTARALVGVFVLGVPVARWERVIPACVWRGRRAARIVWS